MIGSNPYVRLLLLIPYDILHRNIVILSIWAVLALIVVAIDLYRERRLHRAFGYGMTTAIAASYIACWWGYTQMWRDIAIRVLA
jgi:hypothetical protein